MVSVATTSTSECTHEHCVQCIRTSCKYNKFIVPPATAANACPLTQCRQMCGATYHSCKESEHRELCAYERVPCINACYGCPVILLRWTRGKHLSRCPASVVYCTMQWNRWPVFSAERQVRVPFSQNNFHARYGQLDVALALRDQRVLTEGRKAPHSTRRVLRNRLTERFPAVPLPLKRSSYRESQVTDEGLDYEDDTSHIDSFTASRLDHDQVNDLRNDISQRYYAPRNRSKGRCSSSMDTISDDEESYSDAPWMTNKDPPGLCRSILQQLMKPLNGAAAVTSNSQTGNIDNSVDNGLEDNLGNAAGDGHMSSGNNVGVGTSHVVESGDGDCYATPEYVACIVSSSGDDVGVVELGSSNCVTLSIDVVETSANNVTEINQPNSLATLAKDVANIKTATGLTTSASNVAECREVTDLTTSASNLELEATGLIVSASDMTENSDATNTSGYDCAGESQRLEYNGDEVLEYLAMHNVINLSSLESHSLSVASSNNCTSSDYNCASASDNFTSASDNCTSVADNNCTSADDNSSTVISGPSFSQSNNKEPVSLCASSVVENDVELGATGFSDEACHASAACNSQNPPPSPPYCFPQDPLFTPPFTKCNPLSPTSNFRLPIALQHILALDLNIESIAPYCAKPRSMYTFICAQAFRRDEYASHFGNVHGDIHSGLNGWMEARCPLAFYGCTYSVLRLNPRGGAVRFSSVLDSFGFKPTPSQCATSVLESEDLLPPRCCSMGGSHQGGVMENTLYHTIDTACSNQGPEGLSKKENLAVPDMDSSKSTQNEYSLLKTDVCQNGIDSKSQDSTKSIQTESPLNAALIGKELINDAQSAVDTPIDIDCPGHLSMDTESAVNVSKDSPEISSTTESVNEMCQDPECSADVASYAEFKRNKPKHKEPTPEIYTSKDYDSAVSVETARRQPVMLKPYYEYIVEQTPPRDEDTFSRLPFEILQYVGRCLDSFSLCNLALTSHYLRDVCRSLVEQRGIVIQEWEKVPANTWRSHSWVVTYQRWQFSTAFTPIDNWCINDTACISNHLKTCPYFIRAEPKEQKIGLLGICRDVVVTNDNNDSSAQFHPHVVPNRPGYQTAHGKFAEVMTQLASHMMLEDSDEESTPATGDVVEEL